MSDQDSPKSENEASSIELVAASEKSPKQSAKVTSFNNVCSDSEEPLNAADMSKVTSEAIISKSQQENGIEINTPLFVESSVDSDTLDVMEMNLGVKIKQPVISQEDELQKNGEEYRIKITDDTNVSEPENTSEPIQQKNLSCKRKAVENLGNEVAKKAILDLAEPILFPEIIISPIKSFERKEDCMKSEKNPRSVNSIEGDKKPLPILIRNTKSQKGEENTAEPFQQEKSSQKRKAVDNLENEITKQAILNTAEPVVNSLPLLKSCEKKVESAIPKENFKTPKSIKGKNKSLPVLTNTTPEKVTSNMPSVKRLLGKLFVIGENDVGQLGLENVHSKERPFMLDLTYSFIDVAAGGMHSVCLTESGKVITFGCNDEGALGRATPYESLEGVPLQVEIQEKVIQVTAGDSHSAALTESGQVYLWGNFRNGKGSIGLTADGAKRVEPIKILNGVTIVKISSGLDHLACLSSDGMVYTLGRGDHGQLGRLSELECNDGGEGGRAALLEPTVVPVRNADTNNPVIVENVFTASYSTFLKDQTERIYAFGLNNCNNLGCKRESENDCFQFTPKQIPFFENKLWRQITGGELHALALDSEGVVFAFGCKDYGRLGLGKNCEETLEPTVIPTLQGKKCVEVACGDHVSFALTEEGSVYSWGMGTNHQLGHGSDNDCHVPKHIGGSFFESWRAFKVSSGGQHTLILAYSKENFQSDKK